MSLISRIKILCNNKVITLAELERTLNFSNGSIRKWGNNYPSIDKVKKVADYFNVTTDYLISDKEEKNQIAKISFTEETQKMHEAYSKLSPKMRKKILDMINAFVDEGE